MQRTKFDASPCPIARSLDRLGEWWSLLILRDAFHGLTRFDQFQKSLAIAPNMLSRRLAALVEAGLLEKVRYCERPPRDEYRLTEAGRDVWPLLVQLTEFGNRHFAPEGASSQLVHAASGATAEPILVDAVSGQPINQHDFKFAAGPAADDHVRRRMAFADRNREALS